MLNWAGVILIVALPVHGAAEYTVYLFAQLPVLVKFCTHSTLSEGFRRS